MFEKVRSLFSRREPDVQARLDELRRRAPVPMFWLFGKTQSGKTTLVRYLTGASDAEIGQGFRPCTRFSREYDFPTSATPLLRFLDTRGLDEAGYDPAEDLSRFNDQAHMVLVTVKALDHAQENVLNQLRTIRRIQLSASGGPRPDLFARSLSSAAPNALSLRHSGGIDRGAGRPAAQSGRTDTSVCGAR